MNWKGLFAGVVFLTTASMWVGCETTGDHKPYVCQADDIRPGDTLEISFLDIPEAMGEKEFQVRADGTLNMPLIGSVKASGKRYGAFEAELKNLYVPRFYKRLTVVIKPKDRSYSVGGEVKQPSRLPYVGETTVLRAITSAGDFTEFANRRKVEILRANGDREIIDCNKARKDPRKYDRSICPGDVIIVPRSF